MKRDTGLDIIRIAAIWLIVTYHFCGTVGVTDTLFCRYANGGWGSVGTAMFFMLSGYVLRLHHKEIPDLRGFYRKRFLSIYPMFWIAFLAAYLIQAISLGNFRYGGPLWKLLYSVAGIDNYLGFYQIQTYAVVGEWFTAVIVAVYILYPLLNRLFEKYMVPVTLLIAALYFGNILSGIFAITPDANLITGVFLFWLGMLLEKYGRRIRECKILLIPCVLAACLVMFVKLPFFELPWKNLLALCIFTGLLILCQNAGKSAAVSITAGFLSRISYAVYLTHHFIQHKMYVRYGALLVSGKRILFAYVLYLGITLTISAALYETTQITIKKWKKLENIL